MGKIRKIIYWTTTVIALLAFFFYSGEGGKNPTFGPSEAPDLKSREPAAVTPKDKEKKDSKLHQAVLGTDRILDIRETVDESGKIQQTALLERPNFKYPLIVSAIVMDADGNVLSRRETIADHLMVRLNHENDLVQFEKDLNGLGAEIQQQKQNSGIYLVSFDGKSLGNLEKMKSALINTGKISYAEEDQVIHLPRHNPKEL